MSALSLIARKGHVYQPQTNPFELAKSAGQIEMRLIGVQSASVFFGFCSSHDRSLFEEVDRHDFSTTPSAIFALHYRALCKELSAKTPAVQSDGLLKTFDRGLPEMDQQILHKALDWRENITNLSLSELHQDKAELDEIFLAAAFAEMHSCVITFSCSPVVACSGYLQPVFDFSGYMQQDLNDLSTRVFSLALTVLPRSDGQVAILSWNRNADRPCRAFAQSLVALPANRMATAVLRFVFNGCENVAVNPEWWEGLADAQRATIDEQMHEWIGPTPFGHLVDKNALVPQGPLLADWVVTSTSLT